MRSLHLRILSVLCLFSLFVVQMHAQGYWKKLGKCLAGRSRGPYTEQQLAEFNCEEALFTMIKLLYALPGNSCNVSCGLAIGDIADYVKSDPRMGLEGSCNPVGWICYSMKAHDIQASTNQTFRSQNVVSNTHREQGIPSSGTSSSSFTGDGCQAITSYSGLSAFTESDFYQLPGDEFSQRGQLPCKCVLGILYGILPIKQVGHFGCKAQKNLGSLMAAIVGEAGWILTDTARGILTETSRDSFPMIRGFECNSKRECQCNSLSGGLEQHHCEEPARMTLMDQAGPSNANPFYDGGDDIGGGDDDGEEFGGGVIGDLNFNPEDN